MKRRDVIDVEFKEVKRSLWSRIPWHIRTAIIAAIWFLLTYPLPK